MCNVIQMSVALTFLAGLLAGIVLTGLAVGWLLLRSEERDAA